MSTAPPPPDEPRYIPEAELRRLFNEGPYPAMIADGRLRPKYLRDRHLEAPDDKGNQPCTRRQTILYVDGEGNPAVVVFQYRRSDGRLGASGRPDPKRLWSGGQVLLPESQRPPRTS